MTTLLHIALINAVTVLPLAVLVFVVSRLTRRPALTHALWVLVLVKFVTPPLFNLPMTIEVPIAHQSVVDSKASSVTEAGLISGTDAPAPQVGASVDPQKNLNVERDLPRVAREWNNLADNDDARSRLVLVSRLPMLSWGRARWKRVSRILPERRMPSSRDGRGVRNCNRCCWVAGWQAQFCG